MPSSPNRATAQPKTNKTVFHKRGPNPIPIDLMIGTVIKLPVAQKIPPSIGNG